MAEDCLMEWYFYLEYPNWWITIILSLKLLIDDMENFIKGPHIDHSFLLFRL